MGSPPQRGAAEPPFIKDFLGSPFYAEARNISGNYDFSGQMEKSSHSGLIFGETAPKS
jgi:hypothetical protein